MKVNKLLILSSALFLVACAKRDPFKPSTKEIDGETALTRTNEIIEHQNEAQFSWPTKWSISMKMEGEDDGAKGKYSTIESLDLDNLIYASIISGSTGNDSSKEEEYRFWKDNVYYILTNKNGNKSRTEERISRNEVKINMENYNVEQRNLLSGQKSLESFVSTKSEDEEQKRIAEQTSYYDYNYRYGSDDNKSFERTMDCKIDRRNFEEEGTQYKSYLKIDKERELWVNDLQKTTVMYSYIKKELIDDDYETEMEETNTETNFSYNDEVKIQVPNIDDYPLEEK